MSNQEKGTLYLDTRQTSSVSKLNTSNSSANEIHTQIAGQPFWRDPQLAKLASSQDNAATLAETYNAFGANCAKQVHGSFAFLVYDNEKGELTAATDRLGRVPLYYAEHGNHLIVASSIEDLAAEMNGEITLQAIYNYVYFHMIPAPGSAYRNIGKLRAGEQLSWKDQQLRITRYWTPNFHRSNTPSQVDLSIELKELLQNAVNRCVTANPSTGAFLSGGLDSSTVAGMLAQTSNGSAQAFTIGFDVEGYDETPYARATASHFGLKLHEYYVTPDDVVSMLPDIATHYGEPFGNSSALPAYFCARFAASKGVTHLLAGDGGDELFGGNERYAKQELFQKYGSVPSGIRRHIIEPVLAALPAKIPLVEKARSYITQANAGMPERMQSYNFLHRHLPSELFSPDFLQHVNTEEPLDLLRGVYNAPKQASSLDRMLYLDWQYTLADNDLRKVSQMCELAGMGVSYPMLDDDLVEFSLKIPDRLKIKNGKLRYFYKQALSGWLPDVTLEKSKHGFGLPFGLWMQEHKPLKELALDNLLALKERPYFRPEFIDHAIELHRSGHASYYGELIWILVVLELWLRGNA